MFFSAAKVKNTLVAVIWVALGVFSYHLFIAKVPFTALAFVPYLVSALIGVALAWGYCYLLPSQQLANLICLFIFAIFLLFVLSITGLTAYWLIEALVLMLGFLMGGQQFLSPED